MKYGYWLIVLILFSLFLPGCAGKAYRLNQQGIDLAQQKQWEQAITKFEAAAEADPKSSTAYLNLARTYLLMGQPENALVPAQQAAKINPNGIEAYLLQTQAHFSMQKYQQAQKILQKLPEQFPDNHFLFMAIGDIALASRKWKLAIENYSKAIEIEPRFDKIHLQLGRAYLQREMEKARNKQGFVSPLDDPRKAMIHMANVMAGGGMDLDQASACFRKAIYLNPDNIDARIMLGILAFQRTDFNQATLEWEEALQRDPQNSFLHMALGTSAQQRKLFSKAAVHFAQARKLTPNHGQPVLLEIMLEIDRKNYQVAVDKFLKEKEKFVELEQNILLAFAATPISHIPWLVEHVGSKNERMVKFCVRALSSLSKKKETTDQKFWQRWWEKERKKMQRRMPSRRFFSESK